MSRYSTGIDLGTSNSCIAVLESDNPEVISNSADDPITPSVVSIQEDEIIVGKRARSYLLTSPTNTFVSIKRKMGERYTRKVLGKDYTPENISAIILSYLKGCAEGRLGESLDDLVITVPANFNSVQRQATKDAGEIAGFNVLRVINEPTATALYYGHTNNLSEILVVFDLGGGTFDISVVEAADGLYEVVHSQGDNHLGGDDFNMRIVKWIVQEFGKKTGHDIRRNIEAMRIVHEWAIAAKHGLTDNPEVKLTIEDLYDDCSFEGVLTRDMYTAMCSDLLDRIRSVAKEVAKELSKPKFREAYPNVFENDMAGCSILLVGGETRVPIIRRLVDEIFKGQVYSDGNPDEMVALGAALQAGIIQKKGDIGDIVLVDTTALSLGVEVKGGVFSKMIESNTTIPATRTADYTPVEDYQQAVMVKIYQGESELCEKNVKLGEFEVLLQPPRPRQDATIQVTFHLDADDILHIAAVDRKTQAKQNYTIKGSQNLDRETINRLKKEAAEGRDEDHAKAQKISLRNQLNDFAAEVMNRVSKLSVKDPGNKFVQKTEEYARRLMNALEQDDEKIWEQASKDLEAAWQKLLAAMPAATDTASESSKAPPDRADSPPMDSTPSGDVICSNCGAKLAEGYAFCGKCGMPLKKTNCSSCGTVLVEGFDFCVKCGEKII